MVASRARQNAVRFSAVEDVKMDGLLFSRSVLQNELGFRPDQIDYLFAFPGGAALDAPQVQLVPPSAPQPHGTVMDDSLYVTPKVFSTLSQHSLEPASPGTAKAVGTQGTVSTISSIDSCSEIEFACTALEHSSFSDTAVAAEVVEWGKDDIFVEEEVESAMDDSTSLKRKEKDGDDTEETGFESNYSRDLCAQDDRRNSQAVTGEDAFTPVIKRKTKKRNRKLD
ncbi:hypothetical protein NDU88_005697 [Pleurodeles waltl]|uniref:Zinc finger CCHC domain-containing protein n=1 Tax=Pleurodeles waltl TaxID=8319 RepID=A0AAV7WXT8_PLEWA|nr:hypothetical protein NDU88_005697 [Pleurodeles waltl]